jgi:fructose-1-phosphate kinase PfkB-like protein
MVCGSVPPGVPPDFYARLIAAARKKKVRTLLHADADSLRHGIEEKPTVVTPNVREAARLLGRTLLTRTHYLEAAASIRAMGADAVILSTGSRGAVGAFDVGLVEAIPPPVEAMRWGVAAGTATACQPGMRFASLEQTQEVFKQVELRRAE